MSRAEKGQALAEMVIVIPLFLALLAALAFWAHLMLARLALIQLTRDYALLLARDEILLEATQVKQTLALQKLARDISSLKAEHLTQTTEPLPPTPFQDSDPAATQSLQLPGVGGLLQGMLLGQRLKVHYRMRFSGLAGKLFPNGIEMKETVAFKGDSWNNPGKRLAKAISEGASRLLANSGER